jgi:hypothetical protein
VKNCEVLIGPIAGDGGRLYWEGETISLDDPTAELLARLTYVRIIPEPEPEPVAIKDEDAEAPVARSRKKPIEEAA